MHIFLLETFYFIRKFFYLEQIVLFSLLFLKFMASHILDSNRAKLPLWNCKSQDSRTGYMSFWLCISWQFSYGILGLKRSDRSCRFIKIPDNSMIACSSEIWVLWNLRGHVEWRVTVCARCSILTQSETQIVLMKNVHQI